MLFRNLITKYLLIGITLNSVLSPIPTYAIENTDVVSDVSAKLVEAGTWKTGLQEKPTGIEEGKAVEVDGKIYVADRYSSNNAVVEVYDPILDKWEFETTLPSERKSFSMAEIEGKIYFIGGEKSGNYYLNTVDIYDIESKSWSVGANINTGRSRASSVVVGNKIYLLGGRISTSNYGGIEVYDPIKCVWTNQGNMLNPRELMGAVAYGNKIYCAGGLGPDEWVDTLDVYDTTSKTWEVKASMSEEKHRPAIGYYEGRIYLIGGEWDTEPLYTIEEYDIYNNTWTRKEDAPWNISSMASVTVENKLYVIGGWSWESDYNSKTVAAYIMQPTPEDIAEELVIKAENTLLLEDVSEARQAVNQLKESYIKDALSDRLNSIFSQMPSADIKTVSSNSDIYISIKNSLSISLNTNNVTFEDFDGIEDMEKSNAITLSVGSSMPYELNASLESEITNSGKTEVVDESVLSLRINGQDEYKRIASVGVPLNLIDYQDAGENNTHGIDIKLNRGIILKADVYKASIKYEVKQK